MTDFVEHCIGPATGEDVLFHSTTTTDLGVSHRVMFIHQERLTYMEEFVKMHRDIPNRTKAEEARRRKVSPHVRLTVL
jgi:hypothetical protein